MSWTLRSWVLLPAGCNQQPKQPLLHGTSQLRSTTPAMEAANRAKSGPAAGGAKHLVHRARPCGLVRCLAPFSRPSTDGSERHDWAGDLLNMPRPCQAALAVDVVGHGVKLFPDLQHIVA